MTIVLLSVASGTATTNSKPICAWAAFLGRLTHTRDPEAANMEVSPRSLQQLDRAVVADLISSGTKVIIDDQTLPLQGAASHEEAIAKVENHLRGSSALVRWDMNRRQLPDVDTLGLMLRRIVGG